MFILIHKLGVKSVWNLDYFDILVNFVLHAADCKQNYVDQWVSVDCRALCTKAD